MPFPGPVGSGPGAVPVRSRCGCCLLFGGFGRRGWRARCSRAIDRPKPLRPNRAHCIRGLVLHARSRPSDTFPGGYRACYGSAIVVDRSADRWALVCVDHRTVEAYPLPAVPSDISPGTRSRAELLRRRVPDGRTLYAALVKARHRGYHMRRTARSGCPETTRPTIVPANPTKTERSGPSRAHRP
jgi:hypothetical protein